MLIQMRRWIVNLGLPGPRANATLIALQSIVAGCLIAVMLVTNHRVAMLLPFAGISFAVVLLFLIDRRFDFEWPARSTQGGEYSGVTRRLSVARRATELCMDLMLATAAFFGALLLRFEFGIPTGIADRMFASLPLVAAATVAAFAVVGIYRGDWKSISASEGVRFAAASVLAGVFAFAVSKFSSFVIPRTSCVIFVILTFNFLVATRWSSNLLMRLIGALSSSNRRAVMVGADLRGQAAIQHYLHGEGAGAALVGVIDDDPFMHGKFFHGYPVLGSLDDLDRVFQRVPFDEILIVQEQMAPLRMTALQSFASQRGIVLKRFAMSVSQLDSSPPHSPALPAT